MKPKFPEHKDAIIKAINIKLRSMELNETLGLVAGFIYPPLLDEVHGSIMIGGNRLPMVACIGNESGLVYFFALKALLPGIEV